MSEEKGVENSEQKKEAKPEFIKWFRELNKSSGKIAGGKGANLAEIYNLKISVPPGFVVTAQAYDYFIEQSNLKEKLKELLGKINYENTEELNQITTEVRKLIEDSPFPQEMTEEIFESYEDLSAENSHFKQSSAHDLLKKTPEDIFVAVRSSATTEDLADASFAGQQETFLNIKGKTDLLKHIKKCFSSLYTPRATYYRNKKGFKHSDSALAVVVQKMIDSDKSGVIFSKNPAKNEDHVIIEAVWGLGESIVSGRVTPDKYVVSKELEILDSKINIKKLAITRDSSGKKVEVKLNEDRAKRQVLKNHEIKKLAEIAIKLEEHYQKPQDIEFAIEGGEIFITQTRPITTLETRFSEVKEIKGEIILTGLAASPGIASGKIKIIRDLKDLSKINQGDILVTSMTNPDMVVTMQKVAAIVTDEGGLTAHASIVSREMGIPAVVGTQQATTKLKDGEIITVNGFTGNIFKGKVAETVQKEIKPVTEKTKTGIKVLIDLPSFAERAAKTNLKTVGLARLEGTIAESGKHPDFFLQNKNFDEYEEIIFKGVKTIADYFEEIWVRTSDIRSDEFANLEGAPKEKEANPMLGMHGIRYSLKNPEILKAELRAMQRVSKRGKKIGVLLPQVISVEEVQKTKTILKEMNFTEAKLGVMVETPASVQLIREICEEGIDFISFGTNDLTQYILAVDRGNEQVQHLFNEMNPAVLHQLEYVLRVCKRSDVETSICGQAGSKREMVKFLVERGIDSISVNADVAADIAAYVSELEAGQSSDTENEKESEETSEEIVEEKPLPPNVTEKADVEGKKEEESEGIQDREKEINNNNSPDGGTVGASDSVVGQTEMNNRAESGVVVEKDNSDVAEKAEEETLVEEDPAKKPTEEEKTEESEEPKEEEPKEVKPEEESGGINLENEHSPSEGSAPNIPGSEFALQENLEGNEKEEVLDIF